ncbi:MAG: RimK family alpha-L-glutamate ligase [Desulfatibacillaceae bacterium]
MNLVTHNPLRSLGIPGTVHIKPGHMYREAATIREADLVLFPEYWQVNTLVHAFRRSIFPSLATYHLGHDKIEMHRALLAVCPENLPETLILGAGPRSEEEILDALDFPFVAKEVRNSCGSGVFLIENRRDWRGYAEANDVWYTQEYLPVKRDLRVVVIGNRAVAAYWRVAAMDSFHTNVARGGHVDYTGAPAPAVQLVERVARNLGVDHAGFDVIVADGHCHILEFNVFFGLRGLHERKVPVADLVLDYLTGMFQAPGVPDRPVFPKAS